jgi:hypothetical protein
VRFRELGNIGLVSKHLLLGFESATSLAVQAVQAVQAVLTG